VTRWNQLFQGKDGWLSGRALGLLPWEPRLGLNPGHAGCHCRYEPLAYTVAPNVSMIHRLGRSTSLPSMNRFSIL